MTPIQVVLVGITGAIMLLYFRRLRTRLFDRLVFVLIGLIAVVLVTRPDWATAAAHFLGVGRGADLVTYLGLAGLGFLWLQLYTRQRELEEELSELNRQIAILKAKKPEK